MKKIILLALTASIMAGCYKQPDYQRIDKWQILELDSCEYIQADGYHGYVHKGNCRFCKERDSIKWEKRKKELVELMIIDKSTLKITHKDDATTDTIVIFKYKEK